MLDAITDRRSDIAVFLQRKEELGLHFYKNCIHKTNQFSTKYILQKFIQKHQDHLEDLRNEFQHIDEVELDIHELSIEDHESLWRQMCKDFDIGTLTFLEAIRLAIRITKDNIDYYQQLLDTKLNSASHKAVKRIINKKSAYIRSLENEYERLKNKK